MKVILKNYSIFYARRFPNFLDHFVYSSPPDQMITSSQTYQMQLMSNAGLSTSTVPRTNRISAYIARTDCVTSHPRNVWVQLGLVHSCRASFRSNPKVYSFGRPPSASTSRVRRPSIPIASSNHYYPLTICPVSLRTQKWMNSTLKSSTRVNGMTRNL